MGPRRVHAGKRLYLWKCERKEHTVKQRWLVKKQSLFTGKQGQMWMEYDEQDLARWLSGELIQVALPYLTPDEREFLMTGCSPEEWDEIFREESPRVPVDQGPKDLPPHSGELH